MKITLTRVGGYDPACGRVVDPTLETTMPRWKPKAKKKLKPMKRRTTVPMVNEPASAPRAVNDEFEYMTKLMRYDDLPADGTPIPSSTWEAFAVVPRDGESCLVFFHRLVLPGPTTEPAQVPPDPNGVEDQP